MCRYIASDKLSVPKAEIEDILEELKERLEEKYGLKSLIMVVGSVKRNLVTVDENGHLIWIIISVLLRCRRKYGIIFRG